MLPEQLNSDETLLEPSAIVLLCRRKKATQIGADCWRAWWLPAGKCHQAEVTHCHPVALPPYNLELILIPTCRTGAIILGLLLGYQAQDRQRSLDHGMQRLLALPTPLGAGIQATRQLRVCKALMSYCIDGTREMQSWWKL